MHAERAPLAPSVFAETGDDVVGGRIPNTLGVPASADYVAQIRTYTGLQRAVDCARHEGLPLLVIGGGSNVVFTRHFKGIVLLMRIGGCEVIDSSDNVVRLRVGAGVRWAELVAWTVRRGYGGLENLAAIPGTVGAAPVQNIGAYGAELCDVVREVSAFDVKRGLTVTLSKEECQFGYRDSIFKKPVGKSMIICEVILDLPKKWHPNLSYRELARAFEGKPSPTPRQVYLAVAGLRRGKLPDPRVIGNAGSFFKNPVVNASVQARLVTEYPDLVSYEQSDGTFKLAAGWLIDRAGMRGQALGPARVHDRQALVLTNSGGATGADILALGREIQGVVKRTYLVDLEIEPSIY